MPIRSACRWTATAAAIAEACPSGALFEEDLIFEFITDDGGLIGYARDQGTGQPTELRLVAPAQASSVAFGAGALLRPRPLDVANGTGAVLFSVGRPFGSGLPDFEYGVIDPATEQIGFIDTLGDPAIPDGLFGGVWGFNATGTSSVGSYNDWLVTQPRPFAWIDGEGTRLPLPASATALPFDEVSSWAITISDDGRLIGGNWRRFTGSQGDRFWGSFDEGPPTGRAVVWEDGEVTELPHAPVHEDEIRASDLRHVSDDGTVIIGNTWRWRFVLETPTGETSWERIDPRLWIYRDGAFESLDDDPVEEFAPRRISADASVMVGRIDRGTVFGERSAMIWTRETGAMLADEFLADLGVDLDGVFL